VCGIDLHPLRIENHVHLLPKQHERIIWGAAAVRLLKPAAPQIDAKRGTSQHAPASWDET
jgi:hypothetical protein